MFLQPSQAAAQTPCACSHGFRWAASRTGMCGRSGTESSGNDIRRFIKGDAGWVSGAGGRWPCLWTGCGGLCRSACMAGIVCMDKATLQAVSRCRLRLQPGQRGSACQHRAHGHALAGMRHFRPTLPAVAQLQYVHHVTSCCQHSVHPVCPTVEQLLRSTQQR